MASDLIFSIDYAYRVTDIFEDTQWLTISLGF